MEIFGVRLIGFTSQTLHKLVLTLGFLVGILLLRLIVVSVVKLVTGKSRNERVVFWTRQGTAMTVAVLVLISILSIWLNNPGQFATGIGLLTAGVAIALQKVITSFAGYVMILRGKTFSVGDRITIGGVRGDVIALGFLQTRIMEMGEPRQLQTGDPAIWVGARQHTGRIVSVSNDKVFDSPVYNYTREFPYLWEEISIPVSYDSDYAHAEAILLEAARRSTEDIAKMSQDAQRELEEKYFLPVQEMEPKVYCRMTDNWIELTVRFLVGTRGIRNVRDEMFRYILTNFKSSGLSVASATYDIVGLPPIRIEEISGKAAVEKVRSEVPKD